MKVTILKKMIKEGNTNGRDWKIRTLFVKFEDENLYEKIIATVISNGADEDTARRAIKPDTYEGVTTYGFFLNVSKFTFERVEKFGVMDAQIVFPINDKGYINPRIVVKNGIEQVTSYEDPAPFEPQEEEVTGWATKSPIPEPAPEENEKSDIEVESEKVSDIPQMPIPPVSDDDSNNLPF